MGIYSKLWTDAKTRFEKDTDKKKPSKTFLGIRISSGVENAAAEVDKKDPGQMRGGTESHYTTKNVAAFGKAVKDFSKKGEDYCKTLDKSIADEPAKDDLYRSLKLLKADLKKIIAKADQDLAGAQANANKLGAAEMSAATYMKSIKSVVANAVLAIQTVKKTPTVETYNEVFGAGSKSAARNLTQQINNLDKLRTKYPEYNLPAGDVSDLSKALAPWNVGGNREKLKATDDEKADAKTVMAAIKDFSNVVKQVKSRFGV
jgi:hypothetical protein